MRWICICSYLIVAPAAAAELQVKPTDFWTLELSCPAGDAGKGALTARTTIEQPQGFKQVIESPVTVSGGRARWVLDYPLLDEGRFDVKPGNWNGYWIMGDYQFRAELRNGSDVVQRANGTFDPTAVCLRDAYGPIITKYPRQFIECSPERPAYIDTDWMSFTIRTMPQRVSHCTAVVDVVKRQGDKLLAGPWAVKLTGKVQRKRFETKDWPRGEYWIRIRLQKEGKPVGPYLIRKVWKEILPAEATPQRARRVGKELQLLAGKYGFTSIRGIRFDTQPLDKRPDAPLVQMDKPWESELMLIKSLRYNREQGEFQLEYGTGFGDKNREPEFAALPAKICLAVSKDGLKWTKPNLGFVEYRGSKANNLVPPNQAYSPPVSKDSAARLSHDYGDARFRFYDARRDGPVNMQNVFVSAVKRSFPRHCRHESAQRFRVGSWPMERRGNEYLVLTRKPILYLGVGMDLYHSTESIRLHVEDKSTGTLYYFFRPGAPVYAPHDASYDNMHMTRRCIGVMWSSDGLHWDRRLIAVGDEADPLGTELYVITLFAEAKESVSGRPALALENQKFNVAISGNRVYLGALYIYDPKANRQWPEALWTRDLIHWHRFDKRRKMIENSTEPGSYDYGMVKIRSVYYEFGNEWWFPYSAINGLKQDYIGLGRMRTAAELREKYPNYAEMPGFTNWDDYFKRCKSMRYYPAIARAQTGRICFAEPEGRRGELTTGPVILDGKSLILNTAVRQGGSVRVEFLDKRGQPIDGFGREACAAITGDSLAHTVRWKSGDLSRLRQRTIRLRFLLDRARLYSFSAQ